jgi:hypothetical protein
MMRRHWMAHGLRFVLFVAVIVAVLSFVVMSLWNWLMPALFNGHAIGYWEAMGLLVLSKILFGGFRGRPGGHWRRHMMERWAQLTPEEREKFREGMHARCGSFRRAEAEQPPAV